MPGTADQSLAMAMVASSTAPLLLLDGEFAVIAASASFLTTFHVEPPAVAGRPIFALGAGEWDVPQLRSLLAASLSGAEIDAYEMDLKAPDGPHALILNARRLDYGEAEAPRLLLTVTDITGVRLRDRQGADALKEKDDLLREKAILLREVQHRVANSLQIIASVLLQTARKVPSEETRAYLKDAHNRVMSIATVQQQLSATSLDAVLLGPYLGRLCESLGASMIRDPNQITLAVTCDDSLIEANVSVSLGLVVTELVINALKHGFPGHRRGKIVVDYQRDGDNWTLCVQDDGVGMPTNVEAAKPGLGTSIVEALANQLSAGVEITQAHPGTRISIVHTALPVLHGVAPATTEAV
ncbi:sensor histidine kinase [Phenylobacterium sp.]|uniref:sensor histidine kinase n=1 Tax=Phenylobacterium sp. TaxID=1871053 RepID=UPI003BAD4969